MHPVTVSTREGHPKQRNCLWIVGPLLLVACGSSTSTSSTSTAAATTVQIHLEIPSGSAFTVGMFTVDGAGLCPTGLVVPSRFEPVEGTDGRQSFAQNQFKCDDGSGIFFIEMILDFPFDLLEGDDPPEGPLGNNIAWSLKPGFGDYAESSGSGEVSITVDNGVFVFDGTISIE